MNFSIIVQTYGEFWQERGTLKAYRLVGAARLIIISDRMNLRWDSVVEYKPTVDAVEAK